LRSHERTTTARHPRAIGRAAACAAQRGARAAAAAAALAAADAGVAGAQAVLGAGDDATLPGRGRLRVRVTPSLSSATSRLGGPAGTGGDRVPLGAEFSTEALGPAQLPFLGAARDTLRAITGQPALDLSLGTVRVAARTSVQTVPTLVEFGVTRRLALAVTIPYVRRRTSVGIDVNAGGGSGNFGVNPVADATGGASARAANDLAVRNLDVAITQLRAQGAGSAALAAEAQRVRDGIAELYGTGAALGNRPGEFAVPLAGSDAQAAVAARIAALGAQFAARGVTGFDPARVPQASRSRLGTRAFETLLTQAAGGIGTGIVSPLGSYELAGPGDVDVVANLQFLDTFGGDGRDGGVRARVAPRPGVRLRSTLGAGFRAGVAPDPLPELLFQLPAGGGAPAVLLRSATDVAVGGRFSASVVARVASPLSDRATLRVGDAGQAYVPADRVQSVGRRLGRELQLEVTPRYALNEAFAVVAQGAVFDRAADRYSGTFTAAADGTGAGDVTYDAAALGVGTGGRATRVGVGLAYSTLAGFARGRARLPVELSYLHTFLGAASGGRVENTTTEQLSVRVSARLFGR
jgi:hypothetical protein